MPSNPFSRKLRRIIGVDEGILSRVPSERPRYTRLGAIVCFTATLSAFSILIVVSGIVTGGLAMLGAAGFAFFWGLFVLVIDSWLISSTHGTRKAKALVYLPRLLVSVLLGLVIAEPVVILVFRPAIQEQVSATRESRIAAESGMWKKCNPATDETVDAPGCASHRLALPGSPGTPNRKLVELRAKQDSAQKSFTNDENTWLHLTAVAQAECAGTAGPATTGIPGEGPECSQNRAAAARFQRISRLDQRQAELTAMRAAIRTLQDEVTAAETGYGQRVQAAIQQKERAVRDAPVGILEQLGALGRLAGESTPVTVAHWAFRLLLVLFDCLPVLAKWMSGATTYDLLVRKQIDSDVRMFDKRIVRHEEIETAVADAGRDDLVRRPRETHRDHAEADRRAERDRERLRDEETERLFEQIRADLS
jgi:hypothetical protein